MAPPNKPYALPEEHLAFFDEFQGLLKKHPSAAKRFSLADVGGDGAVATAGIPPSPSWECRRTEWGLVCKKVNPVM